MKNHIGAYLDLLLEKCQNLSRQRVFVLLVWFLLIVTLINGISLVPLQHYQRLSENPFVTRTDIDSDNYWQETILLPLVAFFTGMNSRPAFNLLCFLIFCIAHLLFAALTYTRYGAIAALIFTAILMSSSLTTVILSWLGTPDGVTFALTIPFLFIKSPALIFFLAMLGTTNHISLMIAASEILILRWIRRDEVRLSHLVFAAGGGITGYLLIQLFLNLNQIQITVSRLDFALAKSLGLWIEMNANNFPASIFSLFNIQWLILLISLFSFFKDDKTYYLAVLAILFFNYGLTFFTEDTTRIFSLVSWGVLMECIFHSSGLALNKDNNGTSYHRQYLRTLTIIGMVSLIVPRYYSWMGEIHAAPFYEFIDRLVK